MSKKEFAVEDEAIEDMLVELRAQLLGRPTWLAKVRDLATGATLDAALLPR